MKYVILANPKSGKLSIEEKKERLELVARKLECSVLGLDTKSREEFALLARELGKKEKERIIVVAGGDGTFSDVMNVVPFGQELGFLPLGSGNALSSQVRDNKFFNYRAKPKIEDYVNILLRGRARNMDVLTCNERKALLAGIGLEGEVLRRRSAYGENGTSGFTSYLLAVKDTVAEIIKGEISPIKAEIEIDGNKIFEENLSISLAKHAFFGYGMITNPKANIDDGKMHVRLFSGLARMLLDYGASQFWKNSGKYYACEQVKIKCEKPEIFQLDGDLKYEEKEFSFGVLKNCFKLIY